MSNNPPKSADILRRQLLLGSGVGVAGYAMGAGVATAQEGRESKITSTALKDPPSFLDYERPLKDSNDFRRMRAALEDRQAQGGGIIRVNANTVFTTDKPIIVTSNIQLIGEGRSSVIENSSTYTPGGDCIHIGYGNVWRDWDGRRGGGTDADLAQFIEENYTNITTENAVVGNLTCRTSQPIASGGMGIFVINASDCLIYDIWGDGVATPVSVGNDNPVEIGGCRNIHVRGVRQIRGGRWHDLVFISESENCIIENCINRPEVPSTLLEAIMSRKVKNCVFKGNILKFSKTQKKGITLDGGAPHNDEPNLVSGNVIDGGSSKDSIGITVYEMQNQVVKDNLLIGLGEGLRIYERDHIVAGNTFVGCKDDLHLRGGFNVFRNMDLNVGRISHSGSHISTSSWRGNSGFNGERRKVFWGPDVKIDGPDIANVRQDGNGIRTKDGRSVVLWVPVPRDALQIDQIGVRWFAARSGEKIDIQLFNRDGWANADMRQVESERSFLATKTGDQTDFWSGIKERVTNPDISEPDQYWFRITLRFNNSKSVWRNARLTYLAC